uniref:Uncharacterized protein n=1 Tax=Meloidogyne enterolobii TaxID=390850 RepID=A0A6V7UBG3_MELEN|nr:unnamed protein product [Meloidogyne enterolobii]
MPSFFQLLANSGISPLVPPHSTLTAFSSQKSNSTEGGCSDDEEEEKHKFVTEGKHKTWTRRKCIWRWRRRVGNCTKVEACFRLVSCFCFTILLVISFLYSIGWSWTIADLTFADVPASRSNIRIVEIERLCSQNTNKTAPKDCCTVVDILDYTSKTARRALFFGVFDGKFSSDFESEVALIPQKVIYNIFNSDTRLWNIDHFTILNEYVAAMAILPFVVGSLHNDLKLNIYSNKVLIIGLGGGSLDMFWHKRFPWLNITIFEINPNVVKLTEKWFDAVNDDTRHVFVQDGILAFNGKLNIEKGRKAVNNNDSQLYDAIVIDACDPIKNASIKNKNKKQQETDFQQQMPCPSSNLISPTFLGLIKRKLTLKGVAIFNLLPLENEEENVKRFVQRRLAAHFPTCIRYKMAKQSNNILACLPYSITQRRKSSKEPTELTNEMFNFWKIRLATLIREFSFKELLNDSTLMNF